MSNILYYSNYCKNCKELLQEIAKSKVKDDIHFLCIDRRIKKNGSYYIQLENGKEIILPPNITKVPSLLLLNRGNIVVSGMQVKKYILEKTNELNNNATNDNGEPTAFMINDFKNIQSDNFSFLDQSNDELSAKGNGGLRQTHNYVLVNQASTIETPPETYKPDKIGNMSLDEIRAKRNQDVPRGGGMPQF